MIEGVANETPKSMNIREEEPKALALSFERKYNLIRFPITHVISFIIVQTAPVG